MQAGVAQEPGRSRRLHRRCGTDGRDKQQSRPRERPTPAGANRAAAWYRQAKETKCGGTGVEKSESADSTVEVGEPAPRGPGGGKRRIGSWTVGRTDGLDTEPTAVSTQVRQLAERRRKRRRAGARFGVAMPWSEEPDALCGELDYVAKSAVSRSPKGSVGEDRHISRVPTTTRGRPGVRCRHASPVSRPARARLRRGRTFAGPSPSSPDPLRRSDWWFRGTHVPATRGSC